MPSSTFGKADYIYPTFIVTRMPHGISGLLIAAILAAAMSNLSAALNSLSSSSMMDFYLQRHPEIDNRTQLRCRASRRFSGPRLLFALAVLSLHKVSRVIEVGLRIASVAYGALLGVFLLGVLTKRANRRWRRWSECCSASAQNSTCGSATKVPWTWYVAIGTVVTFAIGYAASLLTRAAEKT